MVCREDNKKRFARFFPESGYKESEKGIFGFREINGKAGLPYPFLERPESIMASYFID